MNTSIEAPGVSAILSIRQLSIHRSDGKVKAVERFIEVKMIDGVKYKIRCPEEINELLVRQTTLTNSVKDLERAIDRLQISIRPAVLTLENLRVKYAQHEALVEEARKELEVREKGLIAAQKEAKKRGKAVSPNTVLAVEKAKDYLKEISGNKHGQLAFLQLCLDRDEATLASERRSIEESGDQIARMSAELATNKSRIEMFAIEYIRKNPKEDELV